MGKHNRARRAAKKHQGRSGRHERHEPRQAPPADDPSLDGLWLAGAWRALLDAPPHAAAAAGERTLRQVLDRLWPRGWQPVDVCRFVRKEGTKAQLAIVERAIVDQSGAYAEQGRRVAPEWMAQVDALPPSPAAGYLLGLGTWPTTVLAAGGLLRMLERAPDLASFLPPPHRWDDAGRPLSSAAVPSALLEKIRALLAKAESTTFDAEAEAFTAKAQELMTRHRIDRARLHAEPRTIADGVSGRRIGIDDPYAQAKAMLLSAIASANGANAVFHGWMASSTVIGQAEDLDVIESLYTSLLVQSTAALQREGSKGAGRTTAFRRSFLVAFAYRIGQRLSQAAETVVQEAVATHGTALVPLLEARDEAARERTRQLFPKTKAFRPTVSDGEGWEKGRIFGDVADVSVGERIDRAS